ncbi:MAG: carbamoylphosphate synthase, large subunit [Verrucomicrobiota bacterium]
MRGKCQALRAGFTIEEIFNLTKIDRWFLVQIKEIVDFEEELAGRRIDGRYVANFINATTWGLCSSGPLQTLGEHVLVPRFCCRPSWGF